MSPGLAIHNWMRPEPFERTAERMRRQGYAAVELAGEPANVDTGEVREALDRFGLRCWGTLGLMTEGRDLCHEDAYVRRGSIAYLKDVIDLAADLGGEMVTAVPTRVGKLEPMAAKDREWAWCVESMRELDAHAGERGVLLALEPLNRFETYFLHRTEQALALADAAGESCGVCLDCFHMNIEEADWLAAVRMAGERLANVHAADSNRLAPGQGALDWRALLGTLGEVGYEGCLAVEFVPTPEDRTSFAAQAANVDELTATELRFMRDHAGGWVSEPEYERLVALSRETLVAAGAVAPEPTG